MKNIIISFIVGFILGCIGMYFLRDCDNEVIKVPVKIEVPIPPVKDSFPSIDNPKPIEPSNPIYIKNPINKILQDSLNKVITERDSLRIYKEFTVKRQYQEKFEDSIQTIIVDTETTGTMDKIKVKYEQKPRTIIIDTVTPIKVPKQVKFSAGGELILPDTESPVKLSVKPEIGITNKKGNLTFEVGRDFFNKFTTGGIKYTF